MVMLVRGVVVVLWGVGVGGGVVLIDLPVAVTHRNSGGFGGLPLMVNGLVACSLRSTVCGMLSVDVGDLVLVVGVL